MGKINKKEVAMLICFVPFLTKKKESQTEKDKRIRELIKKSDQLYKDKCQDCFEDCMECPDNPWI